MVSTVTPETLDGILEQTHSYARALQSWGDCVSAAARDHRGGAFDTYAACGDIPSPGDHGLDGAQPAKTEIAPADRAGDKATEKAATTMEKAGDKAASTIDKATEKAAESPTTTVEPATEKADKTLDKATEKADKTLDKATDKADKNDD
jgi:vacuolar-type H+-ATPase subunit H